MVINHLENLCPVCGYEMNDAPANYNICPSCGTEFGINDVNSSIRELRSRWIQNGPRWWSPTDSPPINWDPFTQLARLGVFPGTEISTTEIDFTGSFEWAGQAWDRFVDRPLEGVCT
jgi:hypothetical protein